ncbi:hypothetical protein GCM10011367_03220 [Marinicauda pacifica]|uniref:SDR family NAD(P)-dependent oxidoreductase n=1 Tax=Marinicauda pacifica TaxID=1133559 RepID=A0A4S2HD89_9PROT|nr:SDR family NAD(P)-dependent oxidoreductase [Marinicauda pacifica]TGY94010.1 SDR family NAD(P)-dependent oxidoreductase [Marinicauda pacifica]GGE32108.1 hypothetical protein GCM10011367_03220 [Marinicauda pacifica]
MSPLVKAVNFYGRFLIPFSVMGYKLHGLGKPGNYDALAGQTLLVTGATGGIGAAIVRTAVAQGAQVLAVGRSDEKLARLDSETSGGPGSLVPLKADLSLASETHALLDTLEQRGDRIDTLVNNVGILSHSWRKTEEGFEQMYAVNVLCAYILTEGLFDRGLFAPEATIVNMASGGMYNAPQNLAYMEQGEEGFNGFAAYATHKRAQLVLSDLWTARDGDARAYTMHPGWADTEGVERSLPRFHKILGAFLRSPEQGGDTALWLSAQRPEPQEGRLWFDHRPRPAHVYDSTRQPLASAEEIVSKLREDAARVAPSK